MATTEIVRVRGRGTALDFTVDDAAPLDVVHRELRRFMEGKRGQLTGATVSINLGRRLLKPVEVTEICSLLQGTYRLRVARLWASAERMEDALSAALPAPVTLGAKPPQMRPATAAPSTAATAPEGLPEALVVRRTCRTGTSIRHPGTVIVLGNINPGAEIAAGGDILVMGSLRGMAHAGADGDRGAVVVALSMAAAQLRIADKIAIAPSDDKPGHTFSTPEIAYVSEGTIVVEPYAGSLPEDLGLDLGAELGRG